MFKFECENSNLTYHKFKFNFAQDIRSEEKVEAYVRILCE